VNEQLISVVEQVAQSGLVAWRDSPDPQGIRHVVELLGELLVNPVDVF